MRLIRRRDLPAQPWKNGGGVTREIAVHPEGAGLDGFVWRLSMAEVAADGPFSAFGGIDRTLTVIEGAGLALDFGGGTVALPLGQPLPFPGEAPVVARLAHGPITDLNVMTRRGAARHVVARLDPGDPVPAGTTALVALGPALVDGHDLAASDSLLATPGAALAGPVSGGPLLAVTIATNPATSDHPAGELAFPRQPAIDSAPHHHPAPEGAAAGSSMPHRQETT